MAMGRRWRSAYRILPTVLLALKSNVSGKCPNEFRAGRTWFASLFESTHGRGCTCMCCLVSPWCCLQSANVTMHTHTVATLQRAHEHLFGYGGRTRREPDVFSHVRDAKKTRWEMGWGLRLLALCWLFVASAHIPTRIRRREM